MKKRGQMQISFGMIFSIILIIIFIGFAIFAIGKFLDWRNGIEIGLFVGELQDEIDKAWVGTQTSQKFSTKLPSKIQFVCFIDFDSTATGDQDVYDDLASRFAGGPENMFFYPVGSSGRYDRIKIQHLDMEKTTMVENPLCIANVDGRINFYIKKGYGDVLVEISKT